MRNPVDELNRIKAMMQGAIFEAMPFDQAFAKAKAAEQRHTEMWGGEGKQPTTQPTGPTTRPASAPATTTLGLTGFAAGGAAGLAAGFPPREVTANAYRPTPRQPTILDREKVARERNEARRKKEEEWKQKQRDMQVEQFERGGRREERDIEAGTRQTYDRAMKQMQDALDIYDKEYEARPEVQVQKQIDLLQAGEKGGLSAKKGAAEGREAVAKAGVLAATPEAKAKVTHKARLAEIAGTIGGPDQPGTLAWIYQREVTKYDRAKAAYDTYRQLPKDKYDKATGDMLWKEMDDAQKAVAAAYIPLRDTRKQQRDFLAEPLAPATPTPAEQLDKAVKTIKAAQAKKAGTRAELENTGEGKAGPRTAYERGEAAVRAGRIPDKSIEDKLTEAEKDQLADLYNELQAAKVGTIGDVGAP